MIATYNVHGCVGRDGRLDSDRIAAVLEEIDPDVVALQEVFEGDDVLTSDQLGRLARHLDMHSLSGWTFRRIYGAFGNALLSRLPVREIQRVDLSFPGREPRAAIEAEIDCGSKKLRFVTTHLGLGFGERAKQLAKLLTTFPRDPGRPLVLAGDLNIWLPGRATRVLEQRFGSCPAPRSFPNHKPLFAIDRIFADPSSIILDLQAHHSPLARIASDHLPVWAKLQL